MSSPCCMQLCRAVTWNPQSSTAVLAPSAEILHTPQLAQWQICPRKHPRHQTRSEGSASSSHKPRLDVSDSYHIFPLHCSAWVPAAFLASDNPCSLRSSWTLKALGCGIETYFWMTVVLAYRTVCIHGQWQTRSWGKEKILMSVLASLVKELWRLAISASETKTLQKLCPTEPTMQQQLLGVAYPYTHALSSMFD